jgi:hypothetical protein
LSSYLRKGAVDTSEDLSAKQLKVLDAIIGKYDAESGTAQISYAEIAKATGIPQPAYVIRALVEAGYIANKGGGQGAPANFSVNKALLAA